MVKLAYTLNVEGKGKTRKRTLEEELAIIRSGTKMHLCKSQQLESPEAIRRAGKGTFISLLTLHLYWIPTIYKQTPPTLRVLLRVLVG